MVPKTRNRPQRVNWKARCIELEAVISDCHAALDLVPIGPLSKGQTWIPSETAVQMLRRAKDSVTGYIDRHWYGGKR